MNAQISTLKANIITEQQAVNKIYARLHRYPEMLDTESDLARKAAQSLESIYPADVSRSSRFSTN